MKALEKIDKKADEMLAKIGIKDKDIQNIIEVGGVLLGAVILYKLWRNKK